MFDSHCLRRTIETWLVFALAREKRGPGSRGPARGEEKEATCPESEGERENGGVAAHVVLETLYHGFTCRGGALTLTPAPAAVSGMHCSHAELNHRNAGSDDDSTANRAVTCSGSPPASFER